MRITSTQSWLISSLNIDLGRFTLRNWDYTQFGKGALYILRNFEFHQILIKTQFHTIHALCSLINTYKVRKHNIFGRVLLCIRDDCFGGFTTLFQPSGDYFYELRFWRSRYYPSISGQYLSRRTDMIIIPPRLFVSQSNRKDTRKNNNPTKSRIALSLQSQDRAQVSLGTLVGRTGTYSINSAHRKQLGNHSKPLRN
jgi:hypothetical protein